MKAVSGAAWRLVCFCGDCVLSLACWTLWLALGVVLLLQIAVLVSQEFAVPGFVLRSIEERLNASHVQARFGHASFEPTGRVLIENLRLSLPEFVEPVIDVRAVFIELDPWALLAGQVSPHRIHATGVKFYVPAMLAPSGRSEEILSDLEIVLVPDRSQMVIENLTARVAGVAIAAHGAVEIQRGAGIGRVAPLPLLENLATHYADFSRQLIRVAEKLAAFDRPELTAVLTPSPTRGAIATVRLTAKGVSYPAYQGLRATEIEATSRLPLFGDAPAYSPVTVTLGELRVGPLVARDVNGWLRGALNPGQFSYAPRDIDLTATEVSALGFSLRTPSVEIAPHTLPAVEAALLADCAGSAIAIHANADLSHQTATLHFDGSLSPALLEPIGAAIHHDIRPYIGFGEPVKLNAQVFFEPGWKFARLAGHVDAREIDAYHVPIDSAAGFIEFDGRHFIASRAIARLGQNFARGSFEQDLQTKEFRFLLEGRLRPLAISGWFREWWPDFFEHFEFPVGPPAASVDVAGHWFAGWQTTVFVFAEADGALIRGAKFDYARTRMFIRPNFFDGLELFGTRGIGDLRGTFTRTIDTNENEWQQLTFALESTVDLEAGAKLLGPTLATQLAPYAFEQAPRLKVSGKFDGPASPEGEHHSLMIEARSTGKFSAFKFAAEHLSFTATLRDDNLLLDPIEFQVAEGVLSGRARVWGPESERRLGFDASLHGANFGQAVSAVTRYAAIRHGQPQAAEEKFLSPKNNAKLDLAVSAEGFLDDPFSYHGTGRASLAGAELGGIRLLGLLSDLLNFTALRFTSANAEFVIDGRKLTFPSVSVTGANSAIQAHGDYSLDRRLLDFNARVYPFQESKSFLQSVVGTVLSPLSAVFEVKLTGALDSANWAFVIGPTNFFRAFAQPSAPETPPAPAGSPSPYLKR